MKIIVSVTLAEASRKMGVDIEITRMVYDGLVCAGFLSKKTLTPGVVLYSITHRGFLEYSGRASWRDN